MAQRPLLVGLLGSSNLTVGLPHAVEHLVTRFPGRRLTILAAYGPGRSYEIDGGSLGVKFRSLSRCNLVPAFDQASQENPYCDAFALLTDIGNDLMHGVKGRTLAGRVRTLIERLRNAGAGVAATALPVEGVAALSPRKFRLARTLIYPASRATHDEVVRQASAVQEELREMHSRQEIQLLPARREWYSPDACHIRPARSGEAMREWLDGLIGIGGSAGGVRAAAPALSREGLYLHCRPEYRFFMGKGRPHEARPFAIAPGVTVRGF